MGLSDKEKFGRYCSACNPLEEGEWHGRFDRIYLPKGEFETSSDGNLARRKTGDKNYRKYAVKIETGIP